MKRILILLLLLSSFITAEEPWQNYDITMLLPIDWTVRERLNLAVSIPKGYKSVEPALSWKEAELIEFIPKEEKVDNWSEIITIHKLTNSRLFADKLTASLIKHLSQKVANATVLLKENSNKKYRESTFILAYNYKGKDEILGAKYLSGPYDAVGVQYTIHLNEKLSQQEAVEKIKALFEKHLILLEGTKPVSI